MRKGRQETDLTQEESLQEVVGEKTKNSNQMLEEKRENIIKIIHKREIAITYQLLYPRMVLEITNS